MLALSSLCLCTFYASNIFICVALINQLYTDGHTVDEETTQAPSCSEKLSQTPSSLTSTALPRTTVKSNCVIQVSNTINASTATNVTYSATTNVDATSDPVSNNVFMLHSSSHECELQTQPILRLLPTVTVAPPTLPVTSNMHASDQENQCTVTTNIVDDNLRSLSHHLQDNETNDTSETTTVVNEEVVSSAVTYESESVHYDVVNEPTSSLVPSEHDKSTNVVEGMKITSTSIEQY